jgi:hypothetical protein
MNKRKKTNKDIQKTTQQTKGRATQNTLQRVVNSYAPGGFAVFFLHIHCYLCVPCI